MHTCAWGIEIRTNGKENFVQNHRWDEMHGMQMVLVLSRDDEFCVRICTGMVNEVHDGSNKSGNP